MLHCALYLSVECVDVVDWLFVVLCCRHAD